MKVIDNIGAVERPHASLQMLERQGSFRGFQKLSESSPFKRQLSLRVNELPSTLERQKNTYSNGINNMNGPTGKTPGNIIYSFGFLDDLNCIVLWFHYFAVKNKPLDIVFRSDSYLSSDNVQVLLPFSLAFHCQYKH